jgi:hypothetical protein
VCFAQRRKLCAQGDNLFGGARTGEVLFATLLFLFALLSCLGALLL